MAKSRRTISKAVKLTGVGIHSGADVEVTFKPGTSGQGIVFRRLDVQDSPVIRTRVGSVRDSERRVVLGEGDTEVHTVEHILAAAHALELDDLLVEMDGPEPPIGDGSAEDSFEALERAEPTETDGEVSDRRIVSPFTLVEGDSRYVVAPGDGLRLTVTIEWDHELIGRQSGCFDVGPAAFSKSLAKARTFGFASEVNELRKQGLALGATESNTLVLSESDVLGSELRWPDEFVRHKTVDLLGDLALLGARLNADVVAFKPGHKGNVALARAIERTQLTGAPPVMGVQEILGALPHRYPMLLVDRVVDIEPGKRIVGIKNVTINEPFFQGHFPEHPVMPGVLVVEAMAQVGGMMLMGAFDDPESKVVYFMGIDKVKFRRPVVPGDQLRFELEMLHFRGRNCRMSGVGFVDGKPTVEAEMMARVMDK